MTTRGISVVSTFSGCGGSSLGYKRAGARVLLACEWDKNACETYRLNFPDALLYDGDIKSLTADHVLAICGLRRGELDILDGSPPCQGFSSAGERRFDDSRNQLFREYTRLLRDLQPKAFIMENVSGMVKGKMKLLFAEILRELKSCGYNVKTRLLNAQYYGVPQSRERMIFIGIREDLGIEPSHPAGFGPAITASEALVGVSIDEEERQMLLDAGRRFSAFKQWAIIPPGWSLRDLGYKNGFSCRKADPNRPAYTVTKTDGNLTMHGIMHWSEPRRFTVSEFKRFASFPDDFKFAGSWSDAVQRIGNCVPPKFMEAIATHVIGLLLQTTKTTKLQPSKASKKVHKGQRGAVELTA